jgi:hypothetical protein
MSAMTAFLTLLTEVVTWFVTQIGTILTLFTTNPVLTFCFAIFAVGAVVGLAHRLYRAA